MTFSHVLIFALFIIAIVMMVIALVAAWAATREWSIALLLYFAGHETEAKLISREQFPLGRNKSGYSVIYQYFVDEPEHGAIAYESEQPITKNHYHWISRVKNLTIRYIVRNPSFSRLAGEDYDDPGRFTVTYIAFLAGGMGTLFYRPFLIAYIIVALVMLGINTVLIYFGYTRETRRKKRQEN